MRHTVVVQDVTHHHPGAAAGPPVLQAVSMSLGAGQLVVLAGRSGSGKSTLCHLLAGLTTPARGTVLVDGEPATAVRDWSRLSVLPQRLGLVEELTVAENAAWPCWLLGLSVPASLLEDLGLAAVARRPVHETSLGEQQRAGVARALATRPAVAVLDEPTGHQDDANVVRVVAVLRAAAAAGSTVVVATHDERVVEVADRVVRHDGGRVVGAWSGDGSPTDGGG